MQGVLATLFLPSRAIYPFMIFQILTVGMWGGWLDANYFTPPLLSTGEPVTVYDRAFSILAVQEVIIVSIVRYLRMEMEKYLRLQQVNIKKLEAEIEERQRAETALRESETRYRSLLENIPAITYINGLEPSNPTTYVGPQVERVSGYSSAEFINTPDLWSSLIHPDDRARVLAENDRTNQTGERFVIDYRIITKENKSVWLNDEAVLVKGENGEPLYWLGVWSDISDRKSAELKASQHAEQLATIIQIGHAVSTLQDLDNILEIIYQQVQLIAPVDAFFICLYDKQTNELTFPLTYDMGIRYNEQSGQMGPDSFLRKVFQSGQPYRIHRTAEEVIEAEKYADGVGNKQRKSGSLLFLPLWQAGNVVGILSIQSYSLNAYSDELVETLAGIGDQAASAIQNARLFTSVQQELADRKRAEEKITQSANQLAMLNEIGRAMAALTDLDSVLETIFQQVEQVIPLDAFFVTLYDPLTNRVSHPLVYDQGRRWNEPNSELMPGTNTSRVIQTGNSVLRLLSADELEREKQKRPGLFGDRSRISASLMFVPMTIKGRMIGVISVQSYAINTYTVENLKLLEGVANHVAIAIENARTLHQRPKRACGTQTGGSRNSHPQRETSTGSCRTGTLHLHRFT